MISNNQNVVISGGSSGIGLELCKQLATSGNRVYSFDVQPMPEAINNVESLIVDISDWQQIRRGMDSVRGNVDLLINNAGVMHRGEYFETTQEQWNRLVGVHLTGSYGMIREAHQHFSEKPTIVQISSGHAKNPQKNPFAYSLLKQATAVFADDLAQLYPHYTVKSAFPGPVDTPLTYAELTPEQIADKKLNDKPHSPEYVAGLILKLINSTHKELLFDGTKWEYDFR